MESEHTANTPARKATDALLGEFLGAYHEAGKIYDKTADEETRRTVLEIKRCLDFAIAHLAPLDTHSETRLENLRALFSS